MSVDDDADISYSHQAVKQLMSAYTNVGHCLYIDSYYTSVPLAEELNALRTGVCGTVVITCLFDFALLCVDCNLICIWLYFLYHNQYFPYLVININVSIWCGKLHCFHANLIKTPLLYRVTWFVCIYMFVSPDLTILL